VAVVAAAALVGLGLVWLVDDGPSGPDRPSQQEGRGTEDGRSAAGDAPAPTARSRGGLAGRGAPGQGTSGGDRSGDRPAAADPAAGCTGPHLCVGVAKAVVTPEARFIAGVVEPRLVVGTRLQRFNLGGFGVNPLQGTPDPDASISRSLTAPATGTHFTGSRGAEAIWVRAMVVQEPGGETVALVTLDAVGAGNVIQGRLTSAVAAATGIPAGDVLFGQTHSHAGPDLQGLWGGVPQAWIAEVLYPQAVAAVEAALAASRPATLDVRSGPVDEHNRYRRPKRIDPEVDSETLATLLRARDATSGEVIGDLLQFSAHPTSINERVRVPHPDYILGALDWLEHESGGVALYYNGPIADASSSGSRTGCTAGGDGPYGEVRCRGEGIAAATLAFAPRTVTRPTLEIRHESVVLPVTNPAFLAAGGLQTFNRYYDFLRLPAADLPIVGPQVERGLVDLPQLTPVATTTVSRVTIGGATEGVELVTIPGEATGTFAAFIRSLAAPGANVVLLGLTKDSFGYIIPEEEFSYVDASGDAGFVLPFTGYEELVSLGPLTAPLLRATGYVPLFDADPAVVLPRYLSACVEGVVGDECIVHLIGRHLDYVQTGLAGFCREVGGPEELCSLLNPDTPLASACRPLTLAPGICDLLRRRPEG
jgi:hypothetical protein